MFKKKEKEKEKKKKSSSDKSKKDRGDKKKRSSSKKRSNSKTREKKLSETYNDISDIQNLGKEKIVELAYRHLKKTNSTVSERSFNEIGVTRKEYGSEISIYVRFLRSFKYLTCESKKDIFCQKAGVIFEKGRVNVVIDPKSKCFCPKNSIERNLLKDRTVIKIGEDVKCYYVTHKFDDYVFACYEIDKETKQGKLLWKECPIEIETDSTDKMFKELEKMEGSHKRSVSGGKGKMFKKNKKKAKKMKKNTIKEKEPKEKERGKTKKEKKEKEKKPHTVLFEKGKPDLLSLKMTIEDENLKSKNMIKIIKSAASVLRKEKNVIEINDPVCVIGDIHGQYGEPPITKYLFLGDYVDRGDMGVETCLLLFTYKILFPDKIFLLRGNHESRYMTEEYNFYDEVLSKTRENKEVYKEFCIAFDALPLAAVVGKKYFCVHAGIGPEVKSPNEILVMDRFCEPPLEGIYCDLLWSDPMSRTQNKLKGKKKFIVNKARECSWLYSIRAVEEFLKKNKYLGLIRAHGLEKDGFKFYKKKNSDGPMIISVFSAPDYCSHQNKGAYVSLVNGKIEMKEMDEKEIRFDFFEEVEK